MNCKVARFIEFAFSEINEQKNFIKSKRNELQLKKKKKFIAVSFVKKFVIVNRVFKFYFNLSTFEANSNQISINSNFLE